MTSIDRPAGFAANPAAPAIPQPALPNRSRARSSDLQQRAFRWNYFCNLIDGAFAIFAFQLLQPVLPVFLNRLGLTDTGIGLINALAVIVAVPMPIWGAWLVRHMRRRKPFVVWVGVVQRTHLFLIAAMMLLLLPDHPMAFLAIYVASFLVNQAANQINGPVWTDLVGRVIPADRRGSLFAWRGNIGILPTIFGAGLVGWIIASRPFAENYAILFFLAGICFAISLLFVALIRESVGILDDNPAARNVHPLRDLPRMLRQDHHYRWFLIASAFTTLATGMVTIFFLLTVKNRFGIEPEGKLAMSISVNLIFLFIGNIIFAWIGDRFGHKINLVISIVLTIAACIWALLAPTMNSYVIVFVVIGLAQAASGVSGLPILMEFGGKGNRAKYAAIQNALLTPVALLSPLVGGALRDYAPLPVSFTVAIVFSIIGMLILLTQVPNPRHREM